MKPLCPPSFDSILCWPQTVATEIAKLPCPPHILTKYTSQNAVATKECLPNGEWFKNLQSVTWSNYSLCISSDGKYITTITDLNFHHSEYEEKIINSTLAIVRCFKKHTIMLYKLYPLVRESSTSNFFLEMATKN